MSTQHTLGFLAWSIARSGMVWASGVDGQAHTNGVESFWAMLKRGYHGTYHQMSVKHLQRYVDEFAGRHNVRELDTIDQLATVAQGMAGKRLRFTNLTA